MSIELFIQPYTNLDEFLSASYILLNYSNYGDETILFLVNEVNVKQINLYQLILLRRRLKSSPESYGVNFLKTNICNKVETLLNLAHSLTFQTDETICSVCDSDLESL